MELAANPPRPRLFESLKEEATQVADYFTLSCYGMFSVLIALDVIGAYCKRATWLPGKAFALSGVTVQIIVWWTALSNIWTGYNGHMSDLVYGHQIVVSGRVAVCVFIGYLLPGMSAASVRTFVALAITIIAQIASELAILFDNEQGPISVPLSWKIWIKIVNLILFMCVVFLGLILGCLILASKTINGLLRQRISAISSIIDEDESRFSSERLMSISWTNFEDEVLRSWFVARVCRSDYVISRSVLSSAVGMIITISVIVCLLSNSLFNVYFYFYDIDEYPMDSAIVGLLFSFIIIGWIVICWRWLATQLYFHHSWKKHLCVEDFWTSNTIDLIHMYDLKGDRQRFQDDEGSNSQMSWLSKLLSFPIKILIKIRLHKLLYLLLLLQVSVIFFSKVCGLLSEVIVGRFVYWCRKHMRKGDPTGSLKNNTRILEGDSTGSLKNNTRILECLCMPGEDFSDLWEANQMSYKKAKLLMKNGFHKGESSDKIKSIFCTYSPQWVDKGTELLEKVKERAIPSVLSYFTSVEKRCVKLIVVSLITIFIQLHNVNSDHFTKVVKACSEVWDLLSFVDECDIDLDSNQIRLLDDLTKDKNQVCMAADREFYKLARMKYEQKSSSKEEARRCLLHLLEESEGLLKRENLLGDCNGEVAPDLCDSKDWMKIAPSYTLYKLCKLMLDQEIEDFVAWTEESLRNLIAFSISRLPSMLLKQCWEWAKESEEDKLWEAIQLAGKCSGVMEEWGREPKLKVNTTQKKTLYQCFKMFILCHRVKESPNQGEQTLSKTDQCTLEVKESLG